MEAFFAFLISIALSVPLAIWRGFVLTKLWMWFAVPIFGLPMLGLIPAIGLSLLVGFLVYQHPLREKEADYGKLLGHQISVGIIVPAIALAFGAILQIWM